MEKNMNQIESLLVEREGYLRRGKKDRVAQVDAALASLGYAIEAATIAPETERAIARKPKKRGE